MTDTTRLRFSFARVTIEALTPLTVGTGAGDDTRDALCVTDANGIPAIPGTTLAGLMRHALAGDRDPDTCPDCRSLFGFQEGNQGHSSRVLLSWAVAHDSNNRPVPFRGASLNDPVLAFLAGGVLRDHVRIDLRGIADKHGKFDESLVPAGARFTFEIRVIGDTGSRDLSRLLQVLEAPFFRMGGRTRRGFGRIRVVEVSHRAFDLTRPEDRAQWRKVPRDLHDPVPTGILRPLPRVAPATSTRYVIATLTLFPEAGWIIGGGEPQEEHRRVDKGKPSDRFHDRVPVSEKRVSWSALPARVSEPAPVLPGSSLKGALRHRLGFHARRLANQWARGEQLALSHLERVPPAEETWLFGCIKDQESGSPGRLFVTDLYLAPRASQTLPVAHVSLDRFTQGPMDGLLFSEATLYGRSPHSVEVVIDTHAPHDTILPTHLKQAVKATLDDLCKGRLPLGAGSSKGHGFFEGTLTWSDGGSWIRGEEART